MNKEFNDHNYQDHPHQEGQQQNIAHDRTGKGINEPPEVQRQQSGGGSQKDTRQEGEEGRFESTGRETESERTNRNEDEGIRGGASSV